MAQAVAEVPFDAKEAELLSGGIPRGFKALTTATSKLVKAGWLVKGRNGWTATEEGVRAVRAFPDAEQFVNAMISGAPVPEQPAGEAPVHAPQPPEQLAEEAQVVQAEAALAEDPTPPEVTPTLDISTDEEFADEAATEESVADSDAAAIDGAEAPASGEAWHDQPQSVSLSGDFDPLFGEAGHWSTDLRELQFDYEATENIWKQTLQLPAGTYQFKILVNGSWDENYGRFGVRDGDNHELHLLSDTSVTIRFDYGTKDIETS